MDAANCDYMLRLEFYFDQQVTPTKSNYIDGPLNLVL